MATIKLPNGKRLKLTWYKPTRYNSRSDAHWQSRFKQLCNEFAVKRPLIAGGFLVPDPEEVKRWECEL